MPEYRTELLLLLEALDKPARRTAATKWYEQRIVETKRLIHRECGEAGFPYSARDIVHETIVRIIEKPGRLFAHHDNDTSLEHYTRRCIRSLLRLKVRSGASLTNRFNRDDYVELEGDEAVSQESTSDSIHFDENPYGHRPDHIYERKEAEQHVVDTAQRTTRPGSKQRAYAQTIQQTARSGANEQEIADTIGGTTSSVRTWRRRLADAVQASAASDGDQPNVDSEGDTAESDT